MNLTKQLSRLALVSMALGMSLVSCTNDLSEPGNNGNLANGKLSPIVAPDAVVWSGNQVLGNSFTGTYNATRAESTYTEYKFFKPEIEAELEKAKNINSSGATDFTGNKPGSGTYSIPAGEYYPESQGGKGLLFDNNSNLILYLEKGAKVKDIGDNIGSITIYINDGAELILSSIPGQVLNIYNAGTLTFPNGISSSNIKNIYSTGQLIFGEDGSEICKDLSIYSQGGTIEFYTKENALYDVKCTMICDNLVDTKGNIKFQNNGLRDICILKATGNIELTDGNSEANNFGEIIGYNISFDGNKVVLHPDGHVLATNQVIIPNGRCDIEAYGKGYKGVVECKELVINNMCINEALGSGIYLETETVSLWGNDNDCKNKSLSELLDSRVNTGIKVTPSCSAIANGGTDGGDETTKKCPNLKDNDPDSGCDHPHDGPFCETCDEEGGNCQHPCPNGKCDHPKSDHNPDGSCDVCDDNKDCNACPNGKCDHPKSDHNPNGTCNRCEEGVDCNVGNNPGNGGNGGNGNNGNKPNNGGNGNNGVNNKYTNNEVEINLSLNDIHTLADARAKYGIADLVSKLSIHVRYPHDVEVIIPVPESIYCDQDDLYILNDHYTDGAYGSDPNSGDHRFNGEEHILSYVVGDQPVDLIITYVAAKDDELTPEAWYEYTNSSTQEKSQMKSGGYIRVRTRGIDEAVIDYCRENFGDGINFEVYNYYNRGNMYTTGKYAEITFKDLQFDYLSHSMVNFDWQTKDAERKAYPDFYINSFNHTIEGNPYYGDCYVWIWGDYHARQDVLYNLYVKTLGNQVTMNDGIGTLLKWRDLNYRDTDLTIQSNNFRFPYQGTHFNGSPFNWIYTAKHVTGSIDSSDMPNENGSYWPFFRNMGEKGYHHFRNGNLGNYWYYEFDGTGNSLAPGKPFRNLAD